MAQQKQVKRVPPKWSLWFKGLDEWLLIFQKVSGAILILYLIGHTLVISTALGLGHPSQLTWNAIIGTIEGPAIYGHVHVGTVIEYLIALLAAVHGANGFRLILTQYFGVGLPRPERHTFPRAVPSVRKTGQAWLKYIAVIVVIIFLILATLVAFIW
ncbi:succinate dehydrogenase [Vulcanisaeta sp. JCM 16159]|uniref:succinate dehydrogenase n=1 Tax=Vulcanisaeta sp. JCM 16159 TaxID=1295371 RepID=UPI0006CF9BF4|nr:succinate dehydrogenase [Vulcanisaeta sp. JCM 16159]